MMPASFLDDNGEIDVIELLGSNANTVFFASSQFDSVSVTASLKRRQLYSIFTAFLYGM